MRGDRRAAGPPPERRDLMRTGLERVFAATAICLGLAGCEMDPALMGTTAAAPPAAAQITASTAQHYSAVVDAGLQVPAIPVERVPPEYLRQIVDYPTTQAAGTIIIDPSTKHLYLVTGPNKAMRYGIAVGRAGFAWSGEADITGRTTWPKWIPPYEMIDRRPELEKYRDVGQPGGLTNPLGARALYLTTNGVDYGYRIHGTPEWESIGHNASSGCIRMLNQDVMDLYNRVPDGTRVVVLTESGQFPNGLSVPPKAPAKKKPAAEAAPIIVPMPEVMPAPVVTGVPMAATTAPEATVQTAAAPLLAAPATLPAAAPPCAEALVNGVCPPPKTTP